LAKYFPDVLSTRFRAGGEGVFALAQNPKFSYMQKWKIVFFPGFSFQFVVLSVICAFLLSGTKILGRVLILVAVVSTGVGPGA
jgi:hypothetical protein